MPQHNFSDDPNWKPSALGSTGSIEIEHNGNGFHATGIDFDQQAFNDFIQQVKANIFDECLDKGVKTEEAVERVEILGEYAEERYQDEREKGASHEEAVDAIKKDLPVAKEMVTQNQEIEKNPIAEENEGIKLSDLAASPKSSLDPDAISLQLKKWQAQEEADIKIRAIKNLVLLKAAEFSQNQTQENLNAFQRTLQKLKDVSSSAWNGFCTILGAPQQAEALPAAARAATVFVCEISMFLAENPDFFNKMVQTGLDMLEISDALKRCGDFAFLRSSSKSKPVVKSSQRQASASGSAMPPEGDDGNKDQKKEPQNNRKSPLTKEEKATAYENIKFQLDKLFGPRKKIEGEKYWINEQGNPINIDKLHYDHYHILDKRDISKILKNVFVDWTLK
jgi:hypothetical protein